MPIVHGYARHPYVNGNKMLVCHITGYPAIEVFKFRAEKKLQPPISLGQVTTFLYDDRNPFLAGSGKLIHATLTLRCIQSSKGKYRCPASDYLFNKAAYLTFKDRNIQSPMCYTPCGNLIMTSVSTKPIPDLEHEIKIHMVMIGGVNDLPPSPFPLPKDSPFHIYRDSQAEDTTFLSALSSSGRSTLEAGIQNFGRFSNAVLRPTNSNARPSPAGAFQPLAASTTDEQKVATPPPAGPSQPRSRSSSPSSGTRKITLRSREVLYHQRTIDDYCRPRSRIIPLPKYNIPIMPRPPSPIRPVTPRPTKRKPSQVDDPIGESSAKRFAGQDDLDADRPSTSSHVPIDMQVTQPLTNSQMAMIPFTPNTSQETPPLVDVDDTPPADRSFADGSSNEAGTKTLDYTPDSSGPELLPTPPQPPSPTPPSSPPSQPPSDLSDGSKDEIERVYFNTENALIANASLSHAPPGHSDLIPEHVLIHVETLDPQGHPVRNITHILHFNTSHNTSDIVRAFHSNQINIELPDEGLHDSDLLSLRQTWRSQNHPPSPSSGPSSTNATYGSQEAVVRQPSIVEPSLDIEQLHLSALQNPDLADNNPDLASEPIFNQEEGEGGTEERREEESRK